MSIATPAGAVALVHDRLVVGAAGLGARAALDRAVDVVVGDRGLLGLLDGVVERRVAGRVAAAHPGRDLDVLDQLGEHLAAPGVDDGLLVLRGRPLGVAGHASFPSTRRESVVRSGPRAARAPGRRRPPRGGTTSPAGAPGGPRRSYRRPAPSATRASTSTSGPDLLDPRRADEHRVDRLGRGPSNVEVGLEGVDLAAERVAAHRRRRARRSSPGRRCRPRPGRRAGSSRRRCRTPASRRRAAPAAARAGRRSRASLAIVVDSPPGSTSPSSVVELGGPAYGDARRTPSARRAPRRCSRTSPCSARTPTTGRGHQPRSASRCGCRDLVDVDADHRLAQPAARPWRPRPGRRRTWWP